MALQYLGRLRGMGAERWPRIVGEALNEVRDTGTWADYVSALITKYNLRETWEHSKWGERFWKRQVVDQLEREGARAWREEVEQRQDLGAYKDKQLVLARADYVKNRSGEKAREEIKKKCEWGDHF